MQGSASAIVSASPCNQNSCDIQECLKKNDYMIKRCRGVIMELQQCCEDCDFKSKHCGALSGLISSFDATSKKKKEATKPSDSNKPVVKETKMPKSKDPCNQHACDIQACLKKNHYVMESCRDVILNLQKCCDECDNQSKHCAALSGLIASITRAKPKKNS